MALLDLPPEVFSNVVHHLVQDIGPSTAWTYRQVCKTFAAYIDDDVYLHQPLSALTYSPRYFPDYTLPSKLLVANYGRFLFGRTRKLLDVHTALPTAVNEIADFLMTFETAKDAQSRRNEIVIALCDTVAQTIIRSHSPLQWFTHDCFNSDSGRNANQPTKSKEEKRTIDKLIGAAILGNHKAIEVSLQKGASAWDCSELFGGILLAAMTHNHPETITFVLRHKLPKHIAKRTPDAQHIQKMIEEVIAPAFAKNQCDLAIMLLEWFAKHVPTPSIGIASSMLSSAFESKNMKAIEVAINIKFKGAAKMPWLNFKSACDSGHGPTFKILIDKGILDVNKVWWDTSPLNEAVDCGHINIVHQLLAAGANPDGPSGLDRSGKQKTVDEPLRYAVLHNRVDIVQLLLKHGASLAGHNYDPGDPSLLELATDYELHKKKAKKLSEPRKDTPMIKLLSEAEAAEKSRKKVDASKLTKRRRHGMQALSVSQDGPASD